MRSDFHFLVSCHIGLEEMENIYSVTAYQCRAESATASGLRHIQVGDPLRLSGGQVTFEPGGRTMWHTHPLGQTLIVTSGLGWVQCAGGPIEEIRPGDVVWFPPGEKHWHGATATTASPTIADSGVT
jgi:quercetin dioxygenase-like cupin family protein